MERIGWPGARPSPDERAIVTAQLGRDPRGEVAIAALCEHGLPGVIRTSPRLDDGSPFPTLFYLTCPMAVRAIGRLEAAGEMQALNDRLGSDEGLREAYAAAHDRYRARRDQIDVLDDASSAGGMPARVKCLHALYAHEAADANPIGALVRAQVEPLGCPGPCVAAGERVEGHPGFGGKKRRRV